MRHLQCVHLCITLLVGNHTPCFTAGIDTSKPEVIFEEQVVLSHLDPFNPVACSFGQRDKVFNFGTVIAQLPEGAADAAAANADTAASKADKKAIQGAAKNPKAARASMTGTPATMSTASAATHQSNVGLMDMPGAVKANLKFINPIKVPCTVNFSIKPRSGNQPGELLCRVLCRVRSV